MTVKMNTMTRKKPATLSPVKWLENAWRVRGERLALAQLNNSELNDIGVSYEARAKECRRKFWDFG